MEKYTFISTSVLFYRVLPQSTRIKNKIDDKKCVWGWGGGGERKDMSAP